MTCVCNAPYRQGKATKKKRSYTVMHKRAIGQNRWCRTVFNTFLVLLYAWLQTRQDKKERAQMTTTKCQAFPLTTGIYSSVCVCSSAQSVDRDACTTIWLHLKLETRRISHDFAQYSLRFGETVHNTTGHQRKHNATAQTQGGHFRSGGGNPGSLSPVP